MYLFVNAKSDSFFRGGGAAGGPGAASGAGGGGGGGFMFCGDSSSLQILNHFLKNFLQYLDIQPHNATQKQHITPYLTYNIFVDCRLLG